MRVWKLQASDDPEWHPSAWGYALAETAAEALALGSETSGGRSVKVHAKPPEMLWPGPVSARVIWDS